MKLVLHVPEQVVKQLKSFLGCCAKLGPVLLITATSQCMIWRVINSSKSACLMLTMQGTLFDTFVLYEVMELSAAVLLKHVQAAFRTPKIRQMEIKIDEEAVRISLDSSTGLHKSYRAACIDEEHLSAEMDRGMFPTCITADALELHKVLSSFQANLDEITLVARPEQQGVQAIQMVSYVSSVKEKQLKKRGGTLHTTVQMDTNGRELFKAYSNSATEVADVTFNLKDFAVVVQLCRILHADVVLHMGDSGTPLLAEAAWPAGAAAAANGGQVELELALATLGESVQHSLPEPAPPDAPARNGGSAFHVAAVPTPATVAAPRPHHYHGAEIDEAPDSIQPAHAPPPSTRQDALAHAGLYSEAAATPQQPPSRTHRGMPGSDFPGAGPSLDTPAMLAAADRGANFDTGFNGARDTFELGAAGHRARHGGPDVVLPSLSPHTVNPHFRIGDAAGASPATPPNLNVDSAPSRATAAAAHGSSPDSAAEPHASWRRRHAASAYDQSSDALRSGYPPSEAPRHEHVPGLHQSPVEQNASGAERSPLPDGADMGAALARGAKGDSLQARRPCIFSQGLKKLGEEMSRDRALETQQAAAALHTAGPRMSPHASERAQQSTDQVERVAMAAGHGEVDAGPAWDPADDAGEFALDDDDDNDDECPATPPEARNNDLYGLQF